MTTTYSKLRCPCGEGYLEPTLADGWFKCNHPKCGQTKRYNKVCQYDQEKNLKEDYNLVRPGEC